MSDHRAAILTAITRITDAAKFEDLVRAALPGVDARFRVLTPTGVGTHGKTVRDPVDGIGLLQTDVGAVWVGLGATTQQTNVVDKLKEDYDKFIQVIPSRSIQGLRAIVALATNTALSSENVITLGESAQKDAVQMYVIDAPKLADILTERENHGLAHLFLGVRPRLANVDSLRQASECALEALEATLFGSPALMPPSPVLDDLDAVPGSSLLELIGASGQGKTTTVAQFGRRVAARTGIVLHLPETMVERHSALSGAIDATLKDHGWDFEDSPGSFITSGQSSAEVVIVVDDIQRLAAPQKALDKVRAWSRQIAKACGANVRILCTRWPQAGDLQESSRPFPNRIFSMAPRKSDLVEYAVTAYSALGIDLSRYAASSLVSNLGEDILLLGVHLESAQQGVEPLTPREVWASFINRAVQRAAQEAYLTSLEIEAAWDWLGDHLLASGRLPKQSELMEASKNAGNAKGLAALLQSALLVRTIGETVRYRHDRLRDWHLGTRIWTHHQQNNLEVSWPAAWDPYFNQAVADAVVLSKFDELLVALVASERPEVLFGTLRDPSVSPGAMAAMRDWATANQSDWHLEPGVEFAVQSIIGVRHPELISILEALPPWPSVLLARMAHGDVNAALVKFRQFGLGATYPSRDAALETCLNDYGSRLCEGLKRVLQKPLENESAGAAVDLATAAGAANLAPLVRKVLDGKPNLLHHAIAFEYVAMPAGYENIGERLLSTWLKLRSELGEGEHDVWVDGLRFAFANAPISEEAAKTLCESMIALESGWEGAYLLHDVRTDYGTVATIRLLGHHLQGRSNIYESMSYAKALLFRQHVKQLARASASPCERPAILDLAKNHEDETVRKIATSVWLMDPQPEDLDDVLALTTTENEPQAVRARVEIGDTNTVPWIVEHARDWSHYIEWLVHVWGCEARTGFEEWFDEQLETYHIDAPERGLWYAAKKVLVMVPRHDARRILETRMDRLPSVDQLVQAALCVESDELQGWATDQIRTGPAPSPLLQYMFAGYGSDRDGPRVQIASAQIRKWEPIFEYFYDRDLGELYRICRRDGDESWIRRRLQSLLCKHDRQQLCPTHKDLEDELRTDLARDHSWLGIRLIEDSAASPSELLRALERVIDGHDLEELATSIEWPLRCWCTRETLEEFWARHPPTGRKSSLTKLRTTYLVAMKNAP